MNLYENSRSKDKKRRTTFSLDSFVPLTRFLYAATRMFRDRSRASSSIRAYYFVKSVQFSFSTSIDAISFG